MAKEVYWFHHEGNARRTPNISTMMTIYGAEGYGFYWILLEMMREADNYKIRLTGKYDLQGIANEIRTEKEKAGQFVDDCIKEFNLFESDGEYFWSPSLLIKMDNYNEVCEKRKNAANTRWQKGNYDNEIPM